MSSGMISSKNDPVEKLSKTIFENYSLVEVKVRVWLKDNELPALSELTIKGNVDRAFDNMEVIEHSLVKCHSFESKYCYVKNNDIKIVYEYSEKLYIKNDDGTFDEVNILNISENMFLESDGNLYKLYDLTLDSLNMLYKKYVAKKQFDYDPEEMYVAHVQKGPLTNPSA